MKAEDEVIVRLFEAIVNNPIQLVDSYHDTNPKNAESCTLEVYKDIIPLILKDMIKEAYVSYEVAKLLKEEGFDEECHHVYDGENLEWTNILYGEDVLSNSEILDFDVISAPTQQMAMRWLREFPRWSYISFEPILQYEKYADGRERDRACGYKVRASLVQIRASCGHDIGEFDTYEEAANEAIKFALQFI